MKHPERSTGLPVPDYGIISAPMPKGRTPAKGEDEGVEEIRAALGYFWALRGARQDEIAEGLGVKKAYLSRLLSGDRPLQVSHLFGVARVLDVEPGRLFVGLGRILLAGEQAATKEALTPDGYISAANHDAAISALREHLRAASRQDESGDAPMANLLLTLLDSVDVPVESIGNSTGRLDLANA